MSAPILILAFVMVQPLAGANLLYASGKLPQDADPANLRRREAMAFIVGWNSKTVLLPGISHKQATFSAMGKYLDLLGVQLHHPVGYYLSDPAKDQGARAQEFAEQTYEQLLDGDRRIANHFGIATNVLLTIARCNCEGGVPRTVRTELSGLERLDVPTRLQKVPRTKLRSWAVRIERYFESLLRMRASAPQRQALGISSNPLSTLIRKPKRLRRAPSPNVAYQKLG